MSWPTEEVREVRYTTLIHLRRLLGSVKEEAPLTVVLLLDNAFCGDLPSLITRHAVGQKDRLILVAESGQLPGLGGINATADTSGSLGWSHIALARDIPSAIANARNTLQADERFVVLAPSWCSTSASLLPRE